MRVFEAKTPADAEAWRQYVESRGESSHYHRWGWKQVIENAFEWPTYFLMAEEGDTVLGVLPLVWQKSRLFGSFMTSLPFLNGGGMTASSREAEEALLAHAIELAKRLGVRHLELRFRRDPQLSLPVKTNKVAVTRALSPDREAMFQSLPHKVRTDVRKAMKSEFAAEWLGADGLDDFYRLFAVNMRELGTPAYGKNFFREILGAYPQHTAVCLVRHRGQPVAASFLMGHRETIEAGWSASRYEYLALKPNVFLYWNIFCLAGERGYRVFDFGRSSVGSGTHRFKMQWESQEVQLYWVYWLPEGAELPELNPENARYRLAIKVWSRLPVALTNLIGPPISRCLP